MAGAPLLLLLPVSAVAPETHYVLAVHRLADSSLIDQFGFIVSTR